MNLIRITVLYSLIAILSLSLPSLCLCSDSANPVSDENKTTFLSGCEYDYPPYCIVSPDGESGGFSVELLRATLNTMGKDVVFKVGQLSDLKSDLAEGRIQVLPLMGQTPESDPFYDFTFPYLTMHGTVVIRKGTKDIRSFSDLDGKRVAVLKGDNSEEFVHRVKLDASITASNTFEDALRELSEGKQDAVIIQRLVFFQLAKKLRISNLVSVGPPIKEFAQKLCFAVRKGDSEMLGILNEGLSVLMADGTFHRLQEKWFSELLATGRNKTRIIVGGDKNYPPYEFLDEKGKPAGYNVDLTRAIARRINLHVDIRLDDWNTVREELKKGQIDLLQGMFYSVERDKYFDFSTAHIRVSHALVIRKGSPMPELPDGLRDKAILVQKGDIMHDWVIEHGLGKLVVPVASQEEALRQLSDGKYDCALVGKVAAYYWIEKNGWDNLSVGNASIVSPEYCYAGSEGSKKLLADISQGLAALGKTGEYQRIRDKWFSPYEKYEIGPTRILRYSLYIILPLVVLLLIYVFRANRLHRQPAKATKVLRESEEQ